MAPRVALPENLRCRRHDGRDWRCKRQVMEGKLFCEIHYVQGRLRSEKKKVPDSLKLQRQSRKKKEPTATQNTAAEAQEGRRGRRERGGKEIRVSTGREHLERRKKRKRVLGGGGGEEVVAESEESQKLKAEELLRGFEKRDTKRKGKTTASKLRKKEEKGEKTKKKENVGSGVGGEPSDGGKEVTRDLPYGRMAISPALVTGKGSTADTVADVGPVAVKLGLNPQDCRLVTRRFRSKNIERPPISTVKVLPFAKKVKRGSAAAVGATGRKKCHWCRSCRSSLVKCLSCKKKFFCSDCINERSINEEEVKSTCPVCRGICECRACSSSRSKDVASQEMLKDSCKVSKYISLHYLIHWVLPVLEKINEDQTIEVEIEAKSKALSLSEVEIRQAENGWKEQVSCDKCNFPILDVHRSCSKCSYNLCLNCCRESRGVPESPSRKKSSLLMSRKQLNKCSRSDSVSMAQFGGLSCPSKELGGCGYKTLGLRSVFPFKWIKELEISAKQTVSGHETLKIFEDSLHCSICANVANEAGKEKELIEASKRSFSVDNFLYCPSVHDDHDIMLVHFQKHWRKVHPVIVRDVLLEIDSNLSWDPVTMFGRYIKINSAGCEMGKGGTKGGVNCLDWYEAEFCDQEFFTGSLLKAGMQVRHETMKLKAKLSPVLFQKAFGDHSAKIIGSLPLQEYTNPKTGLLNLIANSPEEPKEPKTEMTPSIHISCGSPEEVMKGELVTALSCNSYDMVNILSHASDVPCSADQISKIKALVMTNNAKDNGGSIDGQNLGNGIARKQNAIIHNLSVPRNSVANILPNSETESDASAICSGSDGSSPEKTADPTGNIDPVETFASLERNSSSEKPCGVQWDVFRQQDTPKLLEYIHSHKDELCNAHGLPKEVVHPIHDGSFFLNSVHKMKLKEEYQIEPWTFKQHLGEAVLVPAGCVYQTRNLKSCVNVVLGFVSPENAGECIKLNEELRALPQDHRARQGILEVEKLAIHKIRKAIDEMHGESSTIPAS